MKIYNISKQLNKPLFNVLVFSVSWALQIIVSKTAFNNGAHPVTYFIQSALVAIILMSLYVVPKKYKEIKRISPRLLVVLIAINIIHYGVGGLLSNLGFAMTTAVNSGFLVKFALIATIVFAAIILKEKVTISKILTVIFMFIGIYLITTNGEQIIPQIGDLLVVGAATTWAFANVLVRKVLRGKELSGEVVAWLRPISGLPVIAIVALLSPLLPVKIGEIFSVNLLQLNQLVLIVLGGIFSALLTIFLNRTLKLASVSYMSMMSMLTPVLVSVLAIVFLTETISLIQIAGGIFVIIAGMITHYLKIDQQ